MRRAEQFGQARPLSDDDEVKAQSIVERPLSDACYQAALRLLGYRSRAEAEMRQRLSRKGFGETEVEQTVARLKASGLIDDAAFAKVWSESRVAGKPRSAYVVKRELRTMGIDAETAEQATTELDDAGAAYRAALPRLKRLKSLPREEARRKLSDFLRRRGFSWTVIERTLGRLREEGLSNQVDTT